MNPDLPVISRRLAISALLAFRASSGLAAAPLTAGEILARIRREVHVPWRAETVDTIKAGSPDTAVTGIATTFMATFDVLQRAAAAHRNLVIAHEPTFYNHLDNIADLKGDPVLAAKREFIASHNLVVFRFHDHWHRRRPDGIQTGMAKALGWDKYQNAENPRLFDLPTTSLRQIAQQIEHKFGIRTMRVVGDPQLPVSKAALLPGAGGSPMQIRMLEREDVELLVIGETREWEAVEYVRDAVTAGRKKALLIMGHVPSEEAGMEECARWLRTFITEVPVEFIPAGEPFWSPERLPSSKSVK